MRTVVFGLVGLVLGLIASLIIFGDDGPGFEINHLILGLGGLVAGIVVQRVARSRGQRP